jgi:hypothetical protein
MVAIPAIMNSVIVSNDPARAEMLGWELRVER